MLAFLKDFEVTIPEDVRIKCSVSIATPDASVFKSGCTDSQIFFFWTCNNKEKIQKLKLPSLRRDLDTEMNSLCRLRDLIRRCRFRKLLELVFVPKPHSISRNRAFWWNKKLNILMSCVRRSQKHTTWLNPSHIPRLQISQHYYWCTLQIKLIGQFDCSFQSNWESFLRLFSH